MTCEERKKRFLNRKAPNSPQIFSFSRGWKFLENLMISRRLVAHRKNVPNGTGMKAILPFVAGGSFMRINTQGSAHSSEDGNVFEQSGRVRSQTSNSPPAFENRKWTPIYVSVTKFSFFNGIIVHKHGHAVSIQPSHSKPAGIFSVPHSLTFPFPLYSPQSLICSGISLSLPPASGH